jgi:hypothetical protein
MIERSLRASRGRSAASRLPSSDRRPDEAQASTTRRSIGRLALGLLTLALVAPTVARADVTLGWNQAWLEGAYGHDLTTQWDEVAWRRVLHRTHENGGTVLRVWLFEGLPKQGIVWSGTRAVGVDPTYLAHVGDLCRLAREEGVRIYWTALSGNWPANWPRGTLDSFRHYNLISDKYGEGRSWRETALGPVLDVIARNLDATWALDLMNEVQGSVRTWFWSDGWTGARRYMRDTSDFVHARVPGLRVTASSGHHTAASDVLAGRFDGVGLDFLDVHVYTDSPSIPDGPALAEYARQRGRAIIVGEAGHLSERTDAPLQARVLRGILEDARRLGFAAVFPWRLEEAPGARFSFFDGDVPRPALAVMRDFAARQQAAHAGPGIAGQVAR